MASDEGRASYGALLAIGEFRALFVAQVVSVLGNVVAQVALAVLIYERTGSALLSALTFTLGFLPFLVGGTVLTGIIDRLPARRTLVSCDLVSALVIAVMVLPVPVPVLLVLIFLAGLVDPVFAGVRAAVLPDILGTGARFVLGRAMFGMVWQGAQVIGYAGGALLLTAVGARGALGLDAASFVASATLVRVGVSRRAPVPVAIPGTVWRAFSHVRLVLADAQVRRLMLFRWLVPACALAPEALIAPFVHVLHRPERDVGVLLTAVAVGMLGSNLLAGRLLSQRWQRRIVVPGAMLNVVALLGLLVPGGLVVSCLLLAASGVGSCYNLGRDSQLIALLPESIRSRALAVDGSGLMVVQGVGFAVWGGIAEVLPVRTTIAVAGALGVVVVLALTRRSTLTGGGAATVG